MLIIPSDTTFFFHSFISLSILFLFLRITISSSSLGCFLRLLLRGLRIILNLLFPSERMTCWRNEGRELARFYDLHSRANDIDVDTLPPSALAYGVRGPGRPATTCTVA